MKKSKTVTLVLLTSTLFLGCEDKVRNQYATWDDCVKDYKDPSKCQTEQARSTTGYHTYYHGPWYYPSRGSNASVNPSVGTHRAIGISRGGFGSGGHGGS